ncbi:MAG TPA: hypothetical protein VN874_07985 [Myxococcales bacterium]|nr:hypothetical protein [Myxococcales bacterium]
MTNHAASAVLFSGTAGAGATLDARLLSLSLLGLIPLLRRGCGPLF